MISTNDRLDRALVVEVVFRKDESRQARVDESLNELVLLADTAGAKVIRRVSQERQTPDPAFFVGKGKAEEIRAICEAEDINLVIFDDDLSGVQIRNLEKIIDRRIIDRSALILDIFGLRARSREAKLQVEMAQLKYNMSRLAGQWQHFSKQYGVIGTRGPGEKQIEVDRRVIKKRISVLRDKLDAISGQRFLRRTRRSEYPKFALVGYTNAGKSTLLNVLSGAESFVENRLFATLDTSTKKVFLSPSIQCLLVDTVGFIRKLPPDLVASFKSTLEEVEFADYILHVVDVSSVNFCEQIDVVNETLAQLGCSMKPSVLVFNKVDRVSDFGVVRSVLNEYNGNSVAISAERHMNLSQLKDTMIRLMGSDIVEKSFRIKPTESEKLAKILSVAELVQESGQPGNLLHLKVRMRKRDWEILRREIHA
ncbi:MAG: GTPase HflX [Bacteroidetes bacterium]|nr:GTPase HflX [Bacteroidota bacterium]MCL5267543.1 GTPase HflX [Bacteroidota bacterium]